MTVLHELNYHELKAGVKAGNVTPDGAVQCCAASLFLEHQAYDDRLVRRGRPPSRYYSEWLEAFTRMVSASPDEVTL
jgi:hypothetical protein